MIRIRLFLSKTKMGTTSKELVPVWVGKKKSNTRCNKQATPVACPVTCEQGCTGFNTEGSFPFKGKNVTCEWVGLRQPRRCTKNPLRSNYPVTCGVSIFAETSVHGDGWDIHLSAVRTAVHRSWPLD